MTDQLTTTTKNFSQTEYTIDCWSDKRI